MLLSVVAASIVMVVARQVSLSARTDAVRYDATTSTGVVADVRAEFEAWLGNDPAFFYERVWPWERARVCHDGTVVEPGRVWPVRCGGTWTYQAADSQAGFAGTDARVRAEIFPPTPSTPLLTFRALVASGTVEEGTTVTYRQDGPGRFVAWSENDLRLDQLARSTDGSPVDGLAGRVYSAGRVFLPTAGSVTLTDTQIAGEAGLVAADADPTVRYYSSRPDSSSEPPVRDIRRIVPAPLSVSGLRSSAADATRLACPDNDPDTGVAPVPELVQVDLDRDGTLDAGDSDVYATYVCLAEGRSLVDVDGTVVTVPSSPEWLVVVNGAASADGPSITVRFPSTPGRYVGDCVLRCDLPALAGPEAAAGTHPGVPGYWDAMLGTFPLPVNGVVAAAGDVHVGLCGPAFTTRGGTCVTHPGSAGPGMQVDVPFTIVAGTVGQPANVWLSGPVRAGTGRLGLVATDSVLVPYWARPPGGQLDIDAAAVALGQGRHVVDAGAPVRTFPRLVHPTGGADDPNVAAVLNWTGAVAGASLDLSFNQFASVRLAADPELARTPPPWLASFTPSWAPVSSNRLAPVAVCGTRICADY